eukprot:1322211-Amphidinium_carterae.1
MAYPFLYEDMRRANEKYELRQDLSEFEAAASRTATSMSHKEHGPAIAPKLRLARISVHGHLSSDVLFRTNLFFSFS